jgi:hypothetical protein
MNTRSGKAVCHTTRICWPSISIFPPPPIVAAAIEGRLPRGFGAKRLMDLPIVWSHQWTALGLKAPAQT